MTHKTQAYTNPDLDAIMRGLEIANPNLAHAYDVLRVALGIESDKPKDVWRVGRMQRQIGDGR